MSASKEEHGGVEYEFDMNNENAEAPQDPTCCDRCGNRCINCLKPILAEYHPLPPNPTILQQLKYALLCPPHGRIGAAIFVFLAGFIWWLMLWSLLGREALPKGNLFSLFILFISCWCGGYLMNLVQLPPLFGMLLVGGALGNVPGIDVAKDIDRLWATGCRQIALAIILIRAGLGLDPSALRRLSFVVIRLAFSPCLVEALACAVAAHFILGFPWQWGFLLGFVIAAVSPAVVVPSLLSLSERGYGIDKGVPTLVIAAASIDDVLAITGFGVLLGITFSDVIAGNLLWNLLRGPLKATVGVVFGTVLGVILWYFPQKKSKRLVMFRSLMLVGAGLLSIFGSKRVNMSGAGPLAVLTLSFVAALRWRKELHKGDKNPVQDVIGVLWLIFQPLLFGLIAAAVKVDRLTAETVGEGIAVLCTGLVFRCLVAFLAVLGTNFNLKERLFIPIAWLPKATVQAAIGGVAYDMARYTRDEELISYGEKILQMAVLSILLTAPMGSFSIGVFGPHLLHCTKKSDKHTHKSEIVFIPGDDNFMLHDTDENVPVDDRGAESVQESRRLSGNHEELGKT